MTDRLAKIKKRADERKTNLYVSTASDVFWLIARVRELTAKCEEKDKRIAELDKTIDALIDPCGKWP